MCLCGDFFVLWKSLARVFVSPLRSIIDSIFSASVFAKSFSIHLRLSAQFWLQHFPMRVQSVIKTGSRLNNWSLSQMVHWRFSVPVIATTNNSWGCHRLFTDLVYMASVCFDLPTQLFANFINNRFFNHQLLSLSPQYFHSFPPKGKLFPRNTCSN